METNQIIESGFIKAFIDDYYGFKTDTYYNDKDRLLYILCSTDLEKEEVTLNQINIIKDKIQKLGNEGLSFAYLQSCKPDIPHEFMEPEKRYDYWLNEFYENYLYDLNSFNPVFTFFESNKDEKPLYYNLEELWSIYPASRKPNETDLILIIQEEANLMLLIECVIDEFNENEYWEFDLEEFEMYLNISKPLEDLFRYSELFVQLNRLEMFRSFLLPTEQTETKNKYYEIKTPPPSEAEGKIKKIHQRTLDKNIRDLDMTNYYVQQRENKNVKDSKFATKRNFKTKENKLISDKTFIRAMESNKEILKKVNLLEDFGWT
ncbi:hypothetical protein [Emticicia oligotrophica]|uniref:hypothetical protein n=1 Tax=Emticicia oligotrophica TaxID=312279 RepID=UPI00273CCBC0|nr:hypothetical protein [Emticicia oligotrophica]